MVRPWLALFVWFCAAVGAAEDPVPTKPSRSDEHVHWSPQRNVKDAIAQEIDEFEKSLKTRLGPKTLAYKPYAAAQNAPQGAQLEALTIEQIVDRLVMQMRKLADRDNQEFMPLFSAFRRAPLARGGDLLSAPVGPLTQLGQHVGNLTFQWKWEQVGGHFLNNWDENDVDEAYEVELNAMLTLGIDLKFESDHKLIVISHSVSRPVVQGWRPTLVASAGKVQPILEARPPKTGR